VRKLRFKQFLRERNQFSKTGNETLLSVSEYYGVKPRAEAFASEEHESRASTLEGYRIVKADDLVMNYMLAWKGAYGVSNHDGIVSPAYSVFKVDQRVVNVRYLHHRVRSDEMKAYFRSRSKGIIESRLRLYPDSLLASYVDIPDLATQRQIADFLDRETARIDLLIEKREKFAALVAEARNSLVAKMICGEGSEKLDTTLHDWTEAHPKHWKGERAKIHFYERIEKSVDGTEELLTVSHITGVTTRAEKEVTMFLAESNEGYKIVHPGDIVINTMWGWMGAMGVSSLHGIISPSYGVYRPTSEAFETDYLDLMLRSKPFVAEVTRRSKGIHSSRLRIYPDAFLDMRLPVPPRDEQVAILTKLRQRTERENALLSKNEKASALLKEYRSALITAAVKGQIDVTTYAKSGTPDRTLDAIQEQAI